MEIKITLGESRYNARLYDTPTARKIAANLPLDAEVNTWGEEIYFPLPLEAEKEEEAQDVQEVGNICYWVNGQVVAIFFGPTPVSEGEEPRAIEPVNLVGRLEGSLESLKEVRGGERIRVEKA